MFLKISYLEQSPGRDLLLSLADTDEKLEAVFGLDALRIGGDAIYLVLLANKVCELQSRIEQLENNQNGRTT